VTYGLPPATHYNRNVAHEYTFAQRVKIALIHGAVETAIRLIGCTLKFQTTIEEGGPEFPADDPRVPLVVSCFWHQCVFSAAWQYRNKGFAVMTSRSFDGEWIARTIEGLGFRAVRGSSSKGGAPALLGMHEELKAGHKVSFTIDGPRGPRFIAKPGPVVLAKLSQAPIICYHLAPKRRWTLNSWDQTLIPKPFTTVHVRFSKMISVPKDATEDVMQQKQQEMQHTLDRVRDYAETQAAGEETPQAASTASV